MPCGCAATWLALYQPTTSPQSQLFISRSSTRLLCTNPIARCSGAERLSLAEGVVLHSLRTRCASDARAASLRRQPVQQLLVPGVQDFVQLARSLQLLLPLRHLIPQLPQRRVAAVGLLLDAVLDGRHLLRQLLLVDALLVRLPRVQRHLSLQPAVLVGHGRLARLQRVDLLGDPLLRRGPRVRLPLLLLLDPVHGLLHAVSQLAQQLPQAGHGVRVERGPVLAAQRLEVLLRRRQQLRERRLGRHVLGGALRQLQEGAHLRAQLHAEAGRLQRVDQLLRLLHRLRVLRKLGLERLVRLGARQLTLLHLGRLGIHLRAQAVHLVALGLGLRLPRVQLRLRLHQGVSSLAQLIFARLQSAPQRAQLALALSLLLRQLPAQVGRRVLDHRLHI
mmetsp:Transcript_23325/g.75127  ORF Transcript_23325/g.75127 Transcript_23325/m.75127 type:complete len:391 (-) Transcript_23325:194-1366(-)